MIALIDGDIIVYEVGFSSDSFATKHDPKLDCEDLSDVLSRVDTRINNINTIVGADSYEVYLTGVGNFRNALNPTYKLNRDPSHRPYWYNEIKHHLVINHGAKIIDGLEADDMLGIRQCTEEDDHTCICTKDKDLDCIPGWHYNWSPSKIDNGMYYIDDVNAYRFFFTQCLTGDIVDNIPGLKKLTGQTATKRIKDILQTLTDPAEMYAYVLDLYGDFDATDLVFKCLWIKRSFDEGSWPYFQQKQ